MTPITALFSLVFLCIQFLLIKGNVESTDYLKREHSLVKPYTDGHWDFVGSTLVTNQYVRLTPDHQSRQGGLWNNMPNRLIDWELHVHFKVHGAGRDLFGDGFAIWYVRDRLQLGNVFGSKDNFHGLGIFLDTYSNQNGPHNHGHPYVSAMVNNGSMSYDHDRDGTHTEVDGCESHFRNLNHDTFMAIRYEKNKLTISMDIDGNNEWKQCLAVDGIRLPTSYYFGASGSTGDLADNHDIISLKLYDIEVERNVEDVDYDNIEPGADFFAPPRDHVEDAKGSFMSSRLTGWRLFIIIFLGILGVAVCVIVGVIVFSNRQEAQRKRFY